MVTAKDIMTNNVIYINPKSSIIEASKIMKDNNIGFLPIIDKNLLIGVITDRDIVTRALSNNTFSNIFSYSTKSPIYMVKEETQLNDIINLMSEKQIRRVPVLNNKVDLVGIIGMKDIMKIIQCDLKGIFQDIINPIHYISNDIKI